MVIEATQGYARAGPVSAGLDPERGEVRLVIGEELHEFHVSLLASVVAVLTALFAAGPETDTARDYVEERRLGSGG